MEDDKVLQVPSIVMEGIEKVKDDGKTNMFDVNAVQYYANENEDYETVNWIEDHKKEFWKIVVGQFKIVD